MDTIELLLSRRSVTAMMLGEPGPDDGTLDKILRVATRVPDHGKLTPWRIQILRSEGQRQLGNLLADLFVKAYPDANEKQIEFERNRPQRAPLLLVVTSKLRKDHKIPEMEQMLSGGAVCYSVLVAAKSLGFSAQWLTEWPAYRPEVVGALGHDPAADRIIGFLYLGTATEAPQERPRPALEDVVSEWRASDAIAPVV